jgi:hypothetical protein
MPTNVFNEKSGRPVIALVIAISTGSLVTHQRVIAHSIILTQLSYRLRLKSTSTFIVVKYIIVSFGI